MCMASNPDPNKSVSSIAVLLNSSYKNTYLNNNPTNGNTFLRWALLIGLPILCLVLYKVILRICFGVVIVPEDRIGLVTKKFVLIGNQELPEGRILATNGNWFRHKHSLPAYTSGNGSGSTALPSSHLPSSPPVK